MTVHRPRKARRPRRPRDPRRPRPGTYLAALPAGASEGDLGAAAQIIADEARKKAAEWSRSIPGAIGITVSGDTATVYCDAPAAYPNEVDHVRHPTFGHDPWVTNKHRPFLGPAAQDKADDAMQRYAQRIDRLAEKAGFTRES